MILAFGALAATLGPVFIYYDTFTDKYGFMLDDFVTMGTFGAQPFRRLLTCFFRIDQNSFYRPTHQIVAYVLTQSFGVSRLFQAGGSYLLQVFAAWALYRAFSRLSHSRMAGVMGAALWSVSSVHLSAFVSPPAMIPERLCAFSLGAAITLFLSKHWKLTPLAVALGLLSKEWAAMILPILTVLWVLMLANAWEQTGSLGGSRNLKRAWVLGGCWLLLAVYVFLQWRYGALRESGRLTPTGYGNKPILLDSWLAVWRGFTCDLEMDFLRPFEFILWPLLPGKAYTAITERPPMASQMFSLALGLMVVIFPLDLIALVRTRKTAIFRPATYFGIAWFILSTMPLSLMAARRSDIPYLALLPSIPLYWLVGSTLRRMQRGAIPGYAAPFVGLILVGIVGSLVWWYPNGVRASYWAKARLGVAGRLQEICKDIGPLPRWGPTPNLVFVGMTRDSRDQGATSAYWGGSGLTAYYRRSINCRAVEKRSDLTVTRDGRLAVKGYGGTLPRENLRVLEKAGKHYVDITSSLFRRPQSEKSP